MSPSNPFPSYARLPVAFPEGEAPLSSFLFPLPSIFLLKPFKIIVLVFEIDDGLLLR